MDDRIIKIYKEVVEVITKNVGRIAPVEISFGYVDKNGICRDGLIIKSCPHTIIETLINNGFILSMQANGLFVDKIK